jgi:hypothetical protein
MYCSGVDEEGGAGGGFAGELNVQRPKKET